MHGFGGYQAGRTFLIERRILIHHLFRLPGERGMVGSSKPDQPCGPVRSLSKENTPWPPFIERKALGAEHPDVARTLNNLAAACQRRGQYREAEDLYYQVLAIQQVKLGMEHFEVARTWNNLARAYFAQGRYQEAEVLYLRALELQERTLGDSHGRGRHPFELCQLLHKTHRNREARKLASRAREIDVRSGRDSIQTADGQSRGPVEVRRTPKDRLDICRTPGGWLQILKNLQIIQQAGSHGLCDQIGVGPSFIRFDHSGALARFAGP